MGHLYHGYMLNNQMVYYEYGKMMKPELVPLELEPSQGPLLAVGKSCGRRIPFLAAKKLSPLPTRACLNVEPSNQKMKYLQKFKMYIFRTSTN